MPVPMEPVGSLPCPVKLQAAIKDFDAGTIAKAQLTAEQDATCIDSITRMEATGSPIVSDGEQRASSFAIYPLTDTLAGTRMSDNLAADGQYFAIFTDGHVDVKPKHGSPDIARDIAFQKITARVKGANMASAKLGLSA